MLLQNLTRYLPKFDKRFPLPIQSNFYLFQSSSVDFFETPPNFCSYASLMFRFVLRLVDQVNRKKEIIHINTGDQGLEWLRLGSFKKIII